MPKKADTPPPPTEEEETETETEETPPPPSTEGDEEEIDLDALIEEKVKAAVGKPKESDGQSEKSDGREPSDEAGATRESPSGGPTPEQARSLPSDIKSAVREVLDEKDHAEEHRRLANPPPPPPKVRKGLSKLLFG